MYVFHHLLINDFLLKDNVKGVKTSMSAMQIMEAVLSTHFVSILLAPITVVNVSLDMLAIKDKGAQIVLESVLMELFVMKTPNV